MLEESGRPVGWPFWFGCALSPFLCACLVWPLRGEVSLALFLWVVGSLLIGFVLGLLVQALWSGAIAIRRGEVGLLDVTFVAVILALACIGGVWLYRNPDLPVIVQSSVPIGVTFSVIQIYARIRPTPRD